MRELSLFSGAGGGLLGTKLLGWEHCGYVEFNEYCQKVIAQRIKDGILDEAPIFSDIRAFLSEGYAASYQGMVDVVTAGFPCQPFSVAGKQQGEDDERNMWPETLAVLRAVRPRYAFLENVPGLLAHEYARRIFADLAESGFDARWRVLSAAEVGAPHKRDRAWIVADSTKKRLQGGESFWEYKSVGQQLGDIRSEMADSTSKFSDVSELYRKHGQCEVPESGDDGCQISNTKSAKFNGEWLKPAGPQDGLTDLCKTMADAKRPGQQGQGRPINAMRPAQEREGQTNHAIANSGWGAEPDVGRVANGVASRVDRLKAIGNGQVSIVAATAWNLLNE